MCDPRSNLCSGDVVTIDERVADPGARCFPAAGAQRPEVDGTVVIAERVAGSTRVAHACE